jgi:hypothetical protein
LLKLLWRRCKAQKVASSALSEAFDWAQRSAEQIGQRDGELSFVLMALGLDHIAADVAFEKLVKLGLFEEALQLAAILEVICPAEGVVLHAYARSLAGEREAGVAVLEAAALDRDRSDWTRCMSIVYLAELEEWAAIARTAPELLRDGIASGDPHRMSEIAYDLADVLFHADPFRGQGGGETSTATFVPGTSRVH